METRTRRSNGRTRALAALLLVTAVLCAQGHPASADVTGDRADAARASTWLAGQLSAGGTYANPLGGSLPDYGLTIDALFAMMASGDQAAATPIVAMLDDQAQAENYFTWAGLVPDAGYEDVIVAGPTAKVLVAALVAGRDPHDFGGYDMVQETLGTIVTDDVEPSGVVSGFRGRIRDYAKNPALASSVHNNANMFGQTLAVIGLAGAGESFAPGTPAEAATTALVRQQCAEGYFRIFFTQVATTDPARPTVRSRTETCDEAKARGSAAPDGDATGFALSAMLAARDAGATGLDEPIARTVAWLEARQSAGGGWGGGVSTEAPNTNSTGLIVQALTDADADPEVIARGVAYLRGLQIERGAIAYNAAGYAAAPQSGPLPSNDTWIRATAQAALGLAHVGFRTLVEGPRDDPTTVTSTTTTVTSSTTPAPVSTVDGPSDTSVATGVGGGGATTVLSGSTPMVDAALVPATEDPFRAEPTLLARTGADTATLAGLGLVLVAAGIILTATRGRMS